MNYLELKILIHFKCSPLQSMCCSSVLLGFLIMKEINMFQVNSV
jgi:hypothetical protein